MHCGMVLRGFADVPNGIFKLRHPKCLVSTPKTPKPAIRIRGGTTADGSGTPGRDDAKSERSGSSKHSVHACVYYVLQGREMVISVLPVRWSLPGSESLDGCRGVSSRRRVVASSRKLPLIHVYLLSPLGCSLTPSVPSQVHATVKDSPTLSSTFSSALLFTPPRSRSRS
jgi:hypothetical protein